MFLPNYDHHKHELQAKFYVNCNFIEEREYSFQHANAKQFQPKSKVAKKKLQITSIFKVPKHEWRFLTISHHLPVTLTFLCRGFMVIVVPSFVWTYQNQTFVFKYEHS